MQETTCTMHYDFLKKAVIDPWFLLALPLLLLPLPLLRPWLDVVAACVCFLFAGAVWESCPTAPPPVSLSSRLRRVAAPFPLVFEAAPVGAPPALVLVSHRPLLTHRSKPRLFAGAAPPEVAAAAAAPDDDEEEEAEDGTASEAFGLLAAKNESMRRCLR